MRLMVLRMIAAGSLSAFNTATPALGGTRPTSGPGLLPARAQLPGPPQLATPPDVDKTGGPPPGRILPRGSLLNLSV